MNKRVASVFIAAVMAAGLVFAQDAVSIKRVVKKGDSFKYRVSADVLVMGTTAVFSAVQSSKVLEVAENGEYTIESEMSDVKVDVGGSVQEQPTEPPTKSRHSASGEILELIGEKVTPTDYSLGTVMTPIVGKGATAVGAKWTIETKGNSKIGSPGVKIDYEITGIEEVMGTKTAVVKFNASETSGDTPMKASGTYWIDMKTGFTVKVNADIKSMIMDPNLPPMDMTLKVEQVK